MATRYIDKEFGANSTTAIADDTTGVAKVRNLPDAAGLVLDKVDGFIKYNDGSNIRTVVNTAEAQTLTNKTLTAATVTPVVTEYVADGAITIASGIAVLTKPTAGAYTLAAPSAAEEGTRITITAGTDAAHVVTAANNIFDGTTGANDTATFAAFIGASITLIAWDTKWLVESLNVVTVVAT